MDVTQLRDRIKWTVDTNADLRRQAELDLRHAEEQAGFINAILDILQAEQDASIRLSTVVYLKNRASRAWSSSDDFPQNKQIPEDEKTNLRDRLLPLLASSPPQIRAQLIPLLQKILNADFPSKWPGFLERTLQLLATNDASSVYAGLQCMFELPPYLMHQDRMVGWCTLFLAVIGKDAPSYALEDDLDERERNHFWKTKKWAYANLNRLFVRYGHPASNQKNASPEMVEFSKSFLTNFAPEILKGYLQQIEKWASKTTWLSKASLSYTLMFLDECIKPKSMWKLLRPHLDTLNSHVLFPILCQSDEDIELFNSDPPEYLHRKLNFYEEVSSPDVAATNFLVSLTKSRKEQTFSILNFVNGIVNKYELAADDQKNPREKEGALRMIGTLASVILGKKSPIADQVEYFFVRHVFPEFRSPHGFLRARACDTLGKFERLDFKDPSNLLTIYRNILESMADPDLPVRVEAALALQPLIRHEVIRTSMQQNIPQIMQQLLKLANEVDVDALANVMEDFVEEFAAELTPFAVALSEQLRDTYLRIVREVLERNSTKDADNDYGDFLDDKSITALGVLQTIGTLILTLEATPDVLMHLETILMPVIQITLENKLYDLYNEVFEIIDSCTFSAKQISPTMWQAFELMHKTFKAGAELYLEDMLPALDNFVAYGSEVMIQTPAYLEALVGMVSDIFLDGKVGGMDRICGCKLAEAIMLNLRGQVDGFVPNFVELAMTVISSNEPKVKSYRIHLMEMVINAVYYSPHIALHVLESNGWTNKFFSSWFSNIESFTRVHDKKLSIVAISSLLTLDASQVPSSVQLGWPRLMQGAVRLFQTLPAAMKNREEATKENDFQLNEDDDDDDETDQDIETWNENGETWTNDDADDAEDVKDESTAYLDFLTEERGVQAQKFGAGGDQSDDDLEEESLLETPLDKVEPYGYFKETLLSRFDRSGPELQTQQPQLYDSLTKILTPNDQQIIQSVIVQADTNEVAAQAVAAAQAAQAAADSQQVNGNAH
ncbi:MAG: hypothetical protein Q9164_002255 [Protoblastenia rupestris]